MPGNTADYCRYFVVTPEARRWGVCVAAAGRTMVRAGTPYPAGRHPRDHQMNWEHGRSLEALQVVLVTGGGGWFETGATGLRRIEAGMVFLLLPAVWHRYRPDPATGWTESWVEARGPLVDSLVGGGVFSEKDVVFDGAVAAGVDEQLDALHRLLMAGPGSNPAMVAAETLRVLALCASLPATPPGGPHIEAAVRKAEAILADRHADAVNIEDLARELGVAYSHFRRSFKTLTGYSPWQYVIQVRLARARRLLASGDATLDDIASRVGFSSGFHLSHAFKQAHGLSPSAWRSSMARSRPDA